MTMLKKLTTASAIALICMAGANQAEERKVKEVTWEDILADSDTTDDVLMYGMGNNAQRYSTLDQVNADTVKHLRPAWAFSFGDEKQRGQETQASVHDGVIYVTGSYSRMWALDAKTGERLWKFEARLPEDIRPCCDVVNRGAAIYGDKVYFGTLDASIYALDRNTGKVVWREKFDDHKVGYTMTGAPTIVKDKDTGRVMLIHGSSGDEFGVIGKLYARDVETGEEIWMRPFVEGALSDAELKALINDAYGDFGHAAVTPLVWVTSRHSEAATTVQMLSRTPAWMRVSSQEPMKRPTMAPPQ